MRPGRTMQIWRGGRSVYLTLYVSDCEFCGLYAHIVRQLRPLYNLAKRRVGACHSAT